MRKKKSGKRRFPGGNRVYYSGTVEILAQDFDGKEATGHEIRDTVERYYTDLGPYLRWTFPAWFDFVRLIPYASDETRFPGRIIELVPRPAYLLDRGLFPKIDCKKKAILIASWARGNGFPYRFLAVSGRPDKRVHHVFPQINFGGGWVTADATFPDFSIGQNQSLTFAAELNP